jgi:protein O-mannosyl-transferase
MAKKAQAAAKAKSGFVSKNRYELILFFVSFIVFANTIGNKYSLDDELVTERNQQVAQGIKGLKKIFTSFYTDGSDSKYSFEYRPVVKATYAIEYSLFGFNPGISHFINVLLYSLTVCVLFRLLQFLFKNYSPLFSFLVCLLFAVHPLHTEVVASLKNRDELLSFLFCLLMGQQVFKVIVNRKWLSAIPAILFFGLGALSKKDAFVFLALIPLMGVYFLRKEIKWWLYIPVAGLAFGLQTLIRKMAISGLHRDRIYNVHENPLYLDPGFSSRVALGAKSFGFYLKMFLVPYPLCFYYGYNEFTIPSFTSPAFLVSVLAGLLVLWAIYKYFRSNPVLSFGLAFFVVAVSIYLNLLVPVVGVVADRFAYVPGLGLCIAFIAALGMVFKIDFSAQRTLTFGKLTPNFRYLVIALCGVFAIYSAARNRDWKDRTSLFTHDIEHLENSAKAHELLASNFSAEASASQDQNAKADFAKKAIFHYERAIQIYPGYITVYNNLGSIYFNLLGDFRTPVQYFRKAIELDSNYTAAYQNLGQCYFRNGDTTLALSVMEKALKKDNGKNPTVLLMVAGIYEKKKDHQRADEYIGIAKKKFPDSDLPHIQHGNFLMSRGDSLECIQQLQYAVDKKTQNAQVYQFLLSWYTRKGNFREAERMQNELMILERNRGKK